MKDGSIGFESLAKLLLVIIIGILLFALVVKFIS